MELAFLSLRCTLRGTEWHAASVVPFVGQTALSRHYSGRSLHLSRSLAKSFYCIIFTPAQIFLCILGDDSLTSSAFRGCQPITYKWLLGDFWTLLGPVLLMRSGILWKGLPAHWQSNTIVETQYKGESPLFSTSNGLLPHYSLNLHFILTLNLIQVTNMSASLHFPLSTRI